MESNHHLSVDQKVLLGCLISLLIVFITDTLIPLGVAGGVPYILVISISLRSSRRRLPLYMAIAGSVLTVICFYSSPAGGETWKVIFNRLLALFAIWTTTILGVQRENALHRVKILSGYLPTCASCKKIKDEQGAWIQMESYVANNSEAQFSHGVCPDCMKKLYPEFSSDLEQTGVITKPDSASSG